ncbi:MAG: hypothetical protein NC548_56385 [Lachnospiraceae bacterium]|nr:hypothetical protein [Lachnospiraceae bacterium]MCM1235105.1 hypothetical protein [Ruminococcus flavefaciens]
MKKEHCIKNLKGMFFLIFLLCVLLFALANLVPMNRKVAEEYTAAVLSLSTREQMGTVQVHFSGIYTQYLLNIVFHDRFVGEFYVEGNKFSAQYGKEAFIDFGNGGFYRRGNVCYYNEKKNLLESLGHMVQKPPLQSGYLILRDAMTEGEDDIILIFPENNPRALSELRKRL